MVSFKGLKEQPDRSKYASVYRWYKNIASYETEFSSLPGDPKKPYTVYGPEGKELTLNQKGAPGKADAEQEEEEEEEDLFGSDDEEENAEATRLREENLAAYKKKKEGKTKPAAKSLVTMDVKPWGESYLDFSISGRRDELRDI